MATKVFHPQHRLMGIRKALASPKIAKHPNLKAGLLKQLAKLQGQ